MKQVGHTRHIERRRTNLTSHPFEVIRFKVATQTEEKLKRDGVNSKQQANTTHFDVGRKVRQTIQELGGTMPEELPTPQVSIKQLENSVKITEKK